MRQTGTNRIDKALEIFCVAALLGSLGLKLYYVIAYDFTIFDTLVSSLMVVAIYFLLTLMQRYLNVWNVFIPATEQNSSYAIHLALDLKVVMMGMTLYTAVCDVWNRYGSSIVFWCIIILALFVIAYGKYQMWKSNKKEQQNKKK